MSVRHLLIVGLVVLAAAPLSMLLFGGGRDAGAAPAATTARAQAPPKTTVEGGCVEHALTYGLTNDQAQADQFARDFLSPLVAHPPLPRPGFYAPGRSPDQAALFHALYHGYVVVRYRPALAATVKRGLRTAVSRAPQPVVVAAGTGMPFAAGAVVYGRTSICATLDRAAMDQLATWVRDARPDRSVP
jgi:hypothetical protein